MNALSVRDLLLPVLLTALVVWSVECAPAQTFSILHSFTGADGKTPEARLLVSGNALYGTTFDGGSSQFFGALFKININGNGYTILNNFSNANLAAYGRSPFADLYLFGNTLYGTASGGGTNSSGTVFKVDTEGDNFAVLKTFGGTPDGAIPYSGVTLSGGTLYGTTHEGGSSVYGTVFKVNTDGNGSAVLENFTNSNGAYPYGDLVLQSNILYGTTQNGGSNGVGTVFKINTDGNGFTLLKNFSNFNGGKSPRAGLLLSGNTLYGTTEQNSGGFGTVFKMNTDGGGYTELYDFAAHTNGDDPRGDLLLFGNTLYGTTHNGGNNALGTVFKINTDGSGFAVLKSFAGMPDGANPNAGLALSGNTLYGTTENGGSSNNGAIFSLMLSPSLTIALAGPDAIVTWPTNWLGYTLQFSTNLSSGAWNDVASGVSTTGTNYVSTNTLNGQVAFFRLKQ